MRRYKPFYLKEDMVWNMIRQAKDPCAACGSWYHRDYICVRCGAQMPRTEDFYIGPIAQYTRVGRPPTGAGWDKKAHKVI
jgi:hypothetical protein